MKRKKYPFLYYSDYPDMELVYGEYYNDCINYRFEYDNGLGFIEYYRTVRE